MIWDILLIVLICFASLLVILMSLILFPVITFGMSAAYRPSQKKVLLHGSWLHPRIVTFSFDPLNKKTVVTLFGFQLLRKSAAERKKESDIPVRKDTAGDNTGSSLPSGEKGEAEFVVSSKLPVDAAISEYKPKQEPEGEEKAEFEMMPEEVEAEINQEAEAEAKPDDEVKPDENEMIAEHKTAVTEKKNKKKEK